MTLDILIVHGIVLTMEGPGCGIIPDGAIGIKRNRIVAVGESSQVQKQYTAHREIDASHKVVMPGFVDVHMHTGDTIVRGGAQDLPARDWMFKGVLAMLGYATQEEICDGSAVNIIEALKAGTTTFGDFYYPMIDMVKNHVKLGTRAVVSSMINELPPDTASIDKSKPYPFDPAVGEKKLQDNIRLIQEYHNSNQGRIQCRFGPHAPDMLSVELLKEIKALGDKYKVNFFTHLSQSPEENHQVLMRTGMRPTALLHQLGYLNERLMAAHMSYATDQEIRQVAEAGCGFASCYNSLCIIDCVLPNTRKFLSYGGKAGLGTDQAAGNNCNLMFNEMKLTSLLMKYQEQDPTFMPAWKVLRMATIEGARALHMEEQIGSLKEGKLADVIIIDLSAPYLNPIFMEPVRNIVPNLVYAARGSEVETVIIDGQVVVDGHKLMTMEEEAVLAKANQGAERISQALREDKKAGELPLVKWTREGYY